MYTAIQGAIGLAVALPILIDASGVSETLPGVGVALAVSSFVTRFMDIPQVQSLLARIGLCDSEHCGRREDEE